MTDWSPAACRVRLSAAAARLEGASVAGELQPVKAELAALLRIVEHQSAEFVALREELERAALRWRELSTQAVPVQRAAEPAISVGTSRADHLNASTYVEKGWARIARGEYAAAEEELRHALLLVPDESMAEALLAWALMHQERYDDALAGSQRVLRSHPEHPIARINIGYICMRKGVTGEAVEHLTRAIRESQDRKAVLYANYYLGLAYLERAMYDDAQKFFRTALEIGPNLAEAWYDLGRALWLSNERERACEVWRGGARSNKFSAWARRCADAVRCVEGGEEPVRGVA